MKKHRPISLDDVVSSPYSRVGSSDLSCDGNRVAYVFEGRIHLIEVAMGSDVELFDGTLPKWSPVNPRTFAFRKPETNGIWIYNADQSDRQVSPQIGHVNLIEWSHDGQNLATVSSKQFPKPDTVEKPDFDTIINVRPAPPLHGSVLNIIDYVTGDVIFSTESEAGERFDSVGWHPDGRLITIASWFEKEGIYDYFYRLFDIDIQTNEQQTRIEPSKREISDPAWAPDGRTLAFSYCPYPYGSAVRHLCGLMDKDKNEIRMLGDEFYVTDIRWLPNSQTLNCSGVNGMTRSIFSIDIITGKTEQITDRLGTNKIHGVSKDGNVLLYSHESPQTLAELFLLSRSDNQRKKLTQFSETIAQYELSNIEVVSWKSFDGLTLEGLLLPPKGQSIGKTHPTIVDLHSGPTLGGEYVFEPAWHWLSAQGYQVFAPVMRGSQQYIWCQPPTDELDYKDSMSGIEWLIQDHLCDPEKIGVHGFSNGASLGAYAIGNSKCFRAAALIGGTYDYRLWIGIQTMALSVCVEELNGMPWEVPDVYKQLSPITYAQNVSAPVLLLNGELDHQEDAELYATYLRSAGKTVEYIVYKGEEHCLRKKEHIRDRWSRTLDWFNKHLRF